MTITQIHIAHNCTGMVQRTKTIKPQEVTQEQAEQIRNKIKARYLKRGQQVDVFFVYVDNNQ